MKVRGTVVGEVNSQTVSTGSGERDLARVSLRLADGGDGEIRSVTLWGKWTESAELLEPGMELAVTDVEEETYRGETQFSTTPDSYVIVEPGYLVDVTDVRSWVQCPRIYYLNKLSGVPLNYPVVKGTLVHEVFGDLLRGRDLEESIDARIDERALELGLLGESREAVAADVRQNAAAIEGWLAQGRLGEDDEWRSERLLVSETFGLKGRADAIRRGDPVELKTGKNLRKEPRFQDKVQATLYGLILEEHGDPVDTGTLLYTKNSALDRNEETGDLTPAKDFSIGRGFLSYVLRMRNEVAAMGVKNGVPTGHEADAKCEYCFERDTCMVVAGRLDQESKAGSIGDPIPAEERAHFERFYRAIEAERRAIHREYAKLWEQSPDERVADDRAIVGLETVDATELAGGRWELRVRRTSGATSKLRDGDLVLANDGDPVGGDAELARIERLDVDEIVLTCDELVDVERVDVYPSELTTDRLLTALHDALLKGEERRRDVLFGRASPTFADGNESLDDGQTPHADGQTPHADDPAPLADEAGTFVANNPAQDEAVRLALAADDYALIHGPPGTGKTYTIARAVAAMLERGERVLLSAFTNRAVDNVLEAVLDAGVDSDRIVRVGTDTGVRPDMRSLLLDRTGDPETSVARLRAADVVAATTASCGSRTMIEESFDVAVVDEAAQLTEPATYAAINRADRFVLVGDHQQLPPVVQAERVPVSNGDAPNGDSQANSGSDGPTSAGEIASTAASESSTKSKSATEPNPLAESLFERLAESTPSAGVLLDRQYRMNQRIQAFSSTEFYDGALRPASAAVAARTLDDLEGISVSALPRWLRDPVAFVDVDGDESTHTDGNEAERIAEIVRAFAAAGVDLADVGVIAPFRAQVSTIARHVPDAVTVDTVDRFQGSSMEVIVVSFVATEDLDGPIFEDYRRLNVALTRPKRALVLVGTASALETDPVYRRMLEWARS